MVRDDACALGVGVSLTRSTTMQSTGVRAGQLLVLCLSERDLVVIHNLETGEQKSIAVHQPVRCTASLEHIAVTTRESGLSIFTLDGRLVKVIPKSKKALIAAFDADGLILAFGFTDGTVSMRETRTWHHLSSFRHHSAQISGLRFAPDGRLFVASADKTASIITLNVRFHVTTRVTLTGHTGGLRDILPLPYSSLCVTTGDSTVRVWDSNSGECLQSISEEGLIADSLELDPFARTFACQIWGPWIICRSSETLEVVRQIRLPFDVNSISIGDSNMLFAGMLGMFTNAIAVVNMTTGEVDPIVIDGAEAPSFITLGIHVFDMLNLSMRLTLY
jgi:WD40 repeat protein